MSKVLSLKSLAADLSAENNGRSITVTRDDFPKLQEPISLIVRSVNYAPFATAMQSAMQALVKKHGADAIPAHERDMASGKAMADHILLGWSGIAEEFSPSLAEEILADPAQREFRNIVFYAASKVGQSEAVYVEQAAKNSEQPSAGE